MMSPSASTAPRWPPPCSPRPAGSRSATPPSPRPARWLPAGWKTSRPCGSAWYGDGQPALTVAQANAAIKEFAVTVSNDDGPSQWEVREAVLDALERGLKAPRGDGTVTVLPVVQRPSRGRQSQFRYVTEPEPGPRVCGNISCRKPLDGRPPLVRYCCNSCRVVAFKRRKRQA